MTSIQERYFRGSSVSVFFFMQRKKDGAAVRCLRLQQHERRKKSEAENPRKQRSCIDVIGPLSLVSRLARFCTHPKGKFHVFDRLKRGEEKTIANLFFRFSYENNKKIRSSK